MRSFSSGFAAHVVLAAILAAVAAGPLTAQTVIPITLDDKSPANPTPEYVTRHKLETTGLINGQQWSISLSFSETALGNVLDYIAKVAAAKPREINLVIDRKGISEASQGLDEPLTLNVKEISVAGALKMVMGEQLDFTVQDDGTVLVSSKTKIYSDLPVRLYDISQVLQAVRNPEEAFHIETDSCISGYTAEKRLQELAEKFVKSSEPWESYGGRSTLQFFGNHLMAIANTYDGHQKFLALCRGLLAAQKSRKESAVAKLPEAEKRLAELRQELSRQRDAIRDLCVKAGTDEAHLTSAAIFGELRRLQENRDKLALQLAGKRNALDEARRVAAEANETAKAPTAQTAAALRIEVADLEGQARAAKDLAEQFKTAPLLALGSQLAETKQLEQDISLRVAAQRHVVQDLWEQTHDLPAGAAQPPAPPSASPAEHGLFTEVPVKSSAAPVSDATTALVAGNNEFACDLYHRLATADKTEKGPPPANLFFSPYSLSTALGLTTLGARGATEQQLNKVLHFTLPPEALHHEFSELTAQISAGAKREYDLAIANALWGRKDFEFAADFLAQAALDYRAAVTSLDFQGNPEDSRQTINAWVENETHDKVKDLLAPGSISPSTRLVLTNAVYFKAPWLVPFEKNSTREAPFFLATPRTSHDPATPAKASLMEQTSKFRYLEEDGVQLLVLPYRQNNLSMIILLPRTLDADGVETRGNYHLEDLAALEKSLTAEKLATWSAAAKSEQVHVFLPRFKMTCEFQMAPTLQSLGLTDAFSLPPADFSGMTGKQDLYLAAVVHKAFVEVNEEGTEAAAATGGTFGLDIENTPPKPRLFRADHPFLFLIRHNATGSILFLGRVMNPAS